MATAGGVSTNGLRCRGMSSLALCWLLAFGLVVLSPSLVFEGGWAGEEPAQSPEPPPVGWQVLLAPTFVGQTINHSPLDDPAGAVALTFDDGPVPGMTDRILDVLKAKQAPATFFVIGKLARSHPQLLRRIAAEGHLIGNHTWGHPSHRLTYEAYLNELDSTCGAVQAQTGVVTVLFRPPNGYRPQALTAAAAARGYALITWSVDPRDWSRTSSGTIVRRVLGNARPGAIVLLHDGARYRMTTVQAVPLIIDGLRGKGLRIVSLAELLGLPTAAVPIPPEESKKG